MYSSMQMHRQMYIDHCSDVEHVQVAAVEMVGAIQACLHSQVGCLDCGEERVCRVQEVHVRKVAPARVQEESINQQ
jgi:hypothetical protein